MNSMVNKAHDTGGEGKPANPKLWHAVTVMARARFAKYPSPAAASWVHKTYVAKGGSFIKPKKRD